MTMAYFAYLVSCIVTLPSLCKPMPCGSQENTTEISSQEKINEEIAPFYEILNLMEKPPTPIDSIVLMKLSIQLKAKLEMLIRRVIKAENELRLTDVEKGSLLKEKEIRDVNRVLFGINHRVDKLEKLLSADSSINSTDSRDARWKSILKLETPIVREFRTRIIDAGMTTELFAKTVREICRARIDPSGNDDVSLPQVLKENSIEEILKRMKIPKDEYSLRTIQLLISPLVLPSTNITAA